MFLANENEQNFRICLNMRKFLLLHLSKAKAALIESTKNNCLQCES